MQKIGENQTLPLVNVKKKCILWLLISRLKRQFNTDVNQFKTVQIHGMRSIVQYHQAALKNI